MLEEASWMPNTNHARRVDHRHHDQTTTTTKRVKLEGQTVVSLPEIVASAQLVKSSLGRGTLDKLGETYQGNALSTAPIRLSKSVTECRAPALSEFFKVHEKRRWSGLPGDVLGVIFGHSMADALITTSAKARKQYQTLLLVNKDANVFARRFLGAQLAEVERSVLELDQHQAECLLADPTRPGFETPAAVGRRARTLGLRIRDLLMLARADYRVPMPAPLAPWTNVTVYKNNAFHPMAYFGMREACEHALRAPLNQITACRPAMHKEDGFSSMIQALIGSLAHIDHFTWSKFPQRNIGCGHDRALGLGGEDDATAVVEMLAQAGCSGAARPEHSLLLHVE